MVEPQQRIADYLEYFDEYRIAHRVDPSEWACGLRRWRESLLSRNGGGGARAEHRGASLAA